MNNSSPALGQIVAQHAQLRALLGELDAEAVRIIRGEPPQIADLPAAFARARRTIEDHMNAEERALGWSLTSADVRASGALALLHEEHARQRDELAMMSRDVATSDDRLCLALAIRGIVSDLLIDFDAEERRFHSLGHDT